jgi:hypothetical protein
MHGQGRGVGVNRTLQRSSCHKSICMLLIVAFFFYVAIILFYFAENISDSLSTIVGLDVPIKDMPSLRISKERYLFTNSIRGKDNSTAAYHPDPVAPLFYPLVSLFASWPSNDVSVQGWEKSPANPSATGRSNKGIVRFDYMVPAERASALRFRDAELPFVLFDIPELDRAAETEFSFDNLMSNLGTGTREIEISPSNRFMYYSKQRSPKNLRDGSVWQPPQESVQMSFSTFLRKAVQEEVSDKATVGTRSLFYYSISAYEVNIVSSSNTYYENRHPGVLVIELLDAIDSLLCCSHT